PPKWTGYQLLALIFGTLLSSQGTDASFVLTLSNTYWGFPPGFRSVFPTLPDHFRVVSDLDLNSVAVGGLCLSAFHHISAYPLRLIIGPVGFEFGHAEFDPARGKS
ncbi:hypothetical protein ACGFYU_37190, partial [Streptomyces sp. NPDC048337]|uniref:hypothetical protein n=1 Tax=Streptomyces sp. NPDC048337 TaxID=3365535 RepID=UPI0037142A72